MPKFRTQCARNFRQDSKLKSKVSASIFKTNRLSVNLSVVLFIISFSHGSFDCSIYPYQSIFLLFCLSFYRLSIHPLFFLLFYPSIHPVICPSIVLSVFLYFIHPSIQPSINLYIFFVILSLILLFLSIHLPFYFLTCFIELT